MYRIGVVLAVILTGCGAPLADSAGIRQLTPQAEALAGRRAAPAVEAKHGGVIRDAEAEQRMERVGGRLSGGMPHGQARYQYHLLNTGEVNAFSLPGGRVYVTRGLYAKLPTDELLAAVIAHETAHIVAKDHFKPSCGTPGEALDREIAADRMGVAYLRAADIPPEAMIGLIRRLRDVQPPCWADRRVNSIKQVSGRPDAIGYASAASP